MTNMHHVMGVRSLSMLLVIGIWVGASAELQLKTPLCSAIEAGSLDKVRALVENNADVNQECSFTKSDYPLLVAVQKGKYEIGLYLVSQGANVNQAGFLGYTPLLRAGENVNPDFAKFLLIHKANINAKLIQLDGLNANIGLDVLSLTTAAYLRNYAFGSLGDRKRFDQDYAEILDVYYEYCFNFQEYGKLSKKRLESEDHPDQASLVNEKIKNKAPNC